MPDLNARPDAGSGAKKLPTWQTTVLHPSPTRFMFQEYCTTTATPSLLSQYMYQYANSSTHSVGIIILESLYIYLYWYTTDTECSIRNSPYLPVFCKYIAVLDQGLLYTTPELLIRYKVQFYNCWRLKCSFLNSECYVHVIICWFASFSIAWVWKPFYPGDLNEVSTYIS